MSLPSPPDCLAQHTHDVRVCSTPVAAAKVAEHADVERQVATATGAHYLDVTPWLCSSVCTAIIGNMDVYLNQDHITATYATYLTNAVEAAVVPLLPETASSPAPEASELVAAVEHPTQERSP